LTIQDYDSTAQSICVVLKSPINTKATLVFLFTDQDVLGSCLVPRHRAILY